MTSSSSDATKDVEGAEVNAPSSPQPNNNNVHHPEQNRSVFPSDEVIKFLECHLPTFIQSSEIRIEFSVL